MQNLTGRHSFPAGKKTAIVLYGTVAVFYSGAVPKRFKGADLKSVRQGNLCVSSNLTGAAIFQEEQLRIRRFSDNDFPF